MPIRPEQAWPLLFDTIKNGTTHAWYQWTVDYAELCRKLIAGEDCETLLRQIVTRETPEQFELRKRLFFSVTRAVCSKAKVPFTKVTRVDGTITEYNYQGEGSAQSEKKKRLMDALGQFFGEESLDDFMDQRFLYLNRMDPNSFVVTEFDAFDPAKEQARPYPLEISSAQAINYSKQFSRIDWLIAQFGTQVEVKAGGTRPGSRFVMYFGWVIDCTEVEFDDQIPETIDVFEGMSPAMVRIGKTCYQVSVKAPFTKRQTPRFQGVQVGHEMHPDVGIPCYVSSIHAAIPRMLSTLKSGSEHSLVMSLQAHPQIFQFLPACSGDVENGKSCVKGNDPASGNTCTICHGSGKRIPTSVLDAMVFDMPLEKEEYFLPLSERKHSHAPDVAIIQFLNEYMQQMERACLQDIFSSTQMELGKVVDTAAKVNIDADAQSSAVMPYARKLCVVHRKLAMDAAAFVDADKGLEVVKEIPNELLLESLTELVDRLVQAQGANSPDINDVMVTDVLQKKLQNRPMDLRRVTVKRRFRPLSHLSSDDRRTALTQGEVTLSEKILLYYEPEVYDAMDKIEGFYFMSDDKQRELIATKVAEIAERVKAEKASDIDFEAQMKEAAGLGPDGRPLETANTPPAVAA